MKGTDCHRRELTRMKNQTQKTKASREVGNYLRGLPQMCFGDTSEYKVCMVKACNQNATDFRQIQCSSYNNRKVAGHFIREWLADLGRGNPCELKCQAKGHHLIYSFGKVIDGTKCKPGGKNVCVNGRCMPIGCDGRVGSYRTIDKCGICGGRNLTCIHYKDVFYGQKSLGHISSVLRNTSLYSGFGLGYNDVAMIPAGATNILISDSSKNLLALADEKGTFIINGNWLIDWPGSYPVADSVVIYNRTKDSVETITIPGPINQNLYVMVLLKESNPGISYEYWLSKEHYPLKQRKFPTAPSSQNIVSLSPKPHQNDSITNSVRSNRYRTYTTSPVRNTSRSDRYGFRTVTSLSAITWSPYHGHFRNINTPTTTTAPHRDRYENKRLSAGLTTKATSRPDRQIKTPTKKKTKQYNHYNYRGVSSTVTRMTHHPGRYQGFSTNTTPIPGRHGYKKFINPKTNIFIKAYDKDSTRFTNFQFSRIFNKWEKVNRNRTNTLTPTTVPEVKTTITPFRRTHSPHLTFKSACLPCKKVYRQTKHFCTSDFVLRVRVLSYSYVNDDIRYELQVIQSYKNTVAISAREYAWSLEKCRCPKLKVRREYIIMGSSDGNYRHNESRLLLDRNSFVRRFRQKRARRLLKLKQNQVKKCSKFLQ
ncbi:uncharacterized protein LOC143236850 isoform X2 [Tachypleus tridentatus]|uniref:uncharacterized protein LOC143236850 isoform X2 n=1 Tax=Tachypleus tridentatus TaxID=6853 RepID=UPI003FD36204